MWSAAFRWIAPAISSCRVDRFHAGPEAGILDWYTVLVAIAALLTLTLHGALWLALKNRGALHARARGLASLVWWGVLGAVIAITLVSFRVQPHLKQSFAARPWIYAFPLIALAGLFGMKVMSATGRALEAFLSSCAFILGMLTSVAAGLYPYVLPASTDPALSLTIYNTAAPRYGLEIGLIWFIPGMLLTSAYFIYTYRSFAGKV
jgi:cytochrome d ubiquinol oxidase subunit II